MLPFVYWHGSGVHQNSVGDLPGRCAIPVVGYCAGSATVCNVAPSMVRHESTEGAEAGARFGAVLNYSMLS